MAPELLEREWGQWFFVAFWHQDEILPASNLGSAGRERLQADRNAHVAQMVERVLGKDEVISSILIMGSMTMNDYEQMN